jgi:dihydroorotase
LQVSLILLVISGSDSAPHPLASKKQSGQAVPAGVFTQPFATQLVLLALEEATERGLVEEQEITQEHLEQFLSRSGRRFYKLPDFAAEGPSKILLERKGETIPLSIKSDDGSIEVGLSRATAPVFSLTWLS